MSSWNVLGDLFSTAAAAEAGCSRTIRARSARQARKSGPASPRKREVIPRTGGMDENDVAIGPSRSDRVQVQERVRASLFAFACFLSLMNFSDVATVAEGLAAAMFVSGIFLEIMPPG